MPRSATVLDPYDEADLERELLRKGVGALAAGRHPCGDCGRTPLAGERVHRYAGVQVVCELCRLLRSGPPEASTTVRHCEHGLTVRVRRGGA